MQAAGHPHNETAPVAQPPEPPAIQLVGVEKSYGLLRPRAALNGVTLRVARGECYGLAGPNGAGKTTLLKILLGLIVPDAGEARLFGCRPELPDIRTRVGFVPEAAEIPHGATPLQLVRRWARLRGLRPSLAAEEGERHLVRLGLKEFLRRPAYRFSKGERQRTLLALALLGEPDLLVLDEPTDGLDPLGRALMRRVIEEECAAGRTVFLNSHLLTETERLCTRVGILHGGRLVREERLDRTDEGSHGSTSIVLSAALSDVDAGQVGLRAAGAPGRYVTDHTDLGELNGTLDRLRSRGALLVEVIRVRPSLEDALRQVAAGGGPSAPVGSEPAQVIEEGPAPTARRGRGLRAASRVGGEIVADLIARRMAWVAVAGAGLLLAGIIYVLNDEIMRGVAAAARMIAHPKDPAGHLFDPAWLGAMAAVGAHWPLFIGSTFLSALFAPALLDPRRSVLLLAQPVSRGDVATGIFAAVCAMTALLFILFDGALFGALWFLGAPPSPLFLVTPLVTLLAFAAVYAGTLCATYVFPNGLFAGILGISQLIVFAILNDLPSAQLGKSHGLGGFLLAVIPRVDDLQFVVRSLGKGTVPAIFPIVGMLGYTVALILLLQVIARRSER